MAALLAALAVALVGGTAVSTTFAVVARRSAALARARQKEATEARDAATAAPDVSREAQAESARLSAGLLLDRGLALADAGTVSEALHWMAAALAASPDPDFQRLVRTHLAGYGARVPTLAHWLDTSHTQAAFTPDGDKLVTAGKAGPESGEDPVDLRVWDVHTGLPLGEPIHTPDAGIASPIVSPDGRVLLAGNGAIQRYQYRPGWASRWDLSEGGRFLGKSVGHTDCVLCAAWLPDGGRFLTGSRDGTVQLWDAATGQPLGPPLGAPAAHPRGAEQLAVSPDGRRLLVRTGDDARLWDLERREPVGGPIGPGEKSPPTDVAFGPGGRSLLVVTEDRGGQAEGGGRRLIVQDFDPAAGRTSGPTREAPYPTRSVTTLRDGRVTCLDHLSGDGRWRWQPADGVQLWRMPRDLPGAAGEGTPTAGPDGPAAGREAEAMAALFVPAAGRVWVAAAGGDAARPWDTAADRPAGPPVPHSPFYRRPRLVASADGRAVATVLPVAGGGGNQQAVRVWHADSGLPAGEPIDQPNAVIALALSPDGSLLATGGHFHDALLWDVKTGRRVGPPLPQGDIVDDLAFSPDGRLLAAATWGREVRLWDVAGAKLLRPPLPHDQRVFRVAFSPDGSRLASACPGAARLWDVGSGREVATLVYERPAPTGGSGRTFACCSASTDGCC